MPPIPNRHIITTLFAALAPRNDTSPTSPPQQLTSDPAAPNSTTPLDPSTIDSLANAIAKAVYKGTPHWVVPLVVGAPLAFAVGVAVSFFVSWVKGKLKQRYVVITQNNTSLQLHIQCHLHLALNLTLTLLIASTGRTAAILTYPRRDTGGEGGDENPPTDDDGPGDGDGDGIQMADLGDGGAEQGPAGVRAGEEIVVERGVVSDRKASEESGRDSFASAEEGDA